MIILTLFGVSWLIEKTAKKVFSQEHIRYLKKKKSESLAIKSVQIGFLIFFVLLWEIAARLEWIDAFVVSSPSRICKTLISLNAANQLWNNIGVTAWETVVGFLLGTVIGVLTAVVIWWSDFIFKVTEPYLVVLNALPKVALGPIIIVWIGAGTKSIIIMALLVSVIIATLNILAGFKNVSSDKILLMKSFGASKFQILTKLIIPANIAVIISTLKINVGMSLIGVITGEFLVASKGIGYLIVYGGQVFKLDLVMAGIFILGVIASVMYFCVSKIESFYLSNHKY